RALSALILEGVSDLGLKLASPRDADQRGGSVMVVLPEALPAQELLTAFRAEGIHADARSQTLRLSPGNLTRVEGVEHMLKVLADQVKGAR
ncbi:MAG: aminotransferase, partial [Albidovulum sp.]